MASLREKLTQAQAGEGEVAQRGQQEDVAVAAACLPWGALPAPTVLCTFSLMSLPICSDGGHTGRAPAVGL